VVAVFSDRWSPLCTLYNARMDARFLKAIDRIDAANAEDPNRDVWDGEQVPAALLYGQRMTKWLDKLYPDASEPLQLAARAQHIRRWEVPRDSYPRDRIGYLKWRTYLYGHHADITEQILREVGYDDKTIAKVRSLLKKERIKTDPDGQALEDVICLCFLENYFAEFAPKHEEEKVVNILRKTWTKMSPTGHAAALKLQMPPEARRLVEKALSP
jgi:hypothetical protein